MAICDGTVRKVSIPFLILAICGWIIYLVGFALFNNRLDDSTRAGLFINATRLQTQEHSAHIDYFPFWCFLITGVFLFIVSFVHLLVGRWFTGIFTHFLTALYLVMGGSLLYFLGLILWQNFNSVAVQNENMLLYILVQWIGCAISTLNIAIFMMLWPLFTDPKREVV